MKQPLGIRNPHDTLRGARLQQIDLVPRDSFLGRASTAGDRVDLVALGQQNLESLPTDEAAGAREEHSTHGRKSA